jgi:periplasmic copper chaperone A
MTITTMSRTRRGVRTAGRGIVSMLAAAVLATGLAACSSGSGANEPAQDATQASHVTIEDAWVKAPEEGKTMTAGFGTLKNDGDEDVRVVSASSPVSETMQLHETVTGADGQKKMQEKDGGFVIPAHGECALPPGANHIMFMKTTQTIQAGDTVDITLTFEDDSTMDFQAPAKAYTGANETYQGGSGASADASSSADSGDMSGMNMGGN